MLAPVHSSCSGVNMLGRLLLRRAPGRRQSSAACAYKGRQKTAKAIAMRKNLAYFTEVSLTTIDNCDQSISCYQTAAGCMNPRDPKDGCSPSRLERRVDAMLSDFNGGNNHTVTVVLRGHTANILEITGQFPGTMQYAENLHVLIAQAIEH